MTGECCELLSGLRDVNPEERCIGLFGRGMGMFTVQRRVPPYP